MPQYDRTMKRLTSVFTRDYVRFVLGAESVDVEPVTIEEQDKELPALSREVDFVARVRREGQDALLLLEFQTAWAPTCRSAWPGTAGACTNGTANRSIPWL